MIDGGLKITDFNILNKALKVALTARMKSRNVASWKIIPNPTLERYKKGSEALEPSLAHSRRCLSRFL